MNELEVGRLLRMLRLRRGWTLDDVARRSRVSRATLGRTEAGRPAVLETLRRHAAALDVRLTFGLVGRRADLPRLRDDEHAAITDALARAYQRSGGRAEAEVSFSRFGEHGRIDLLACSGAPATLAVVEVKTELADLQDALGGLDAKARLAPAVARDLGWPQGRVVRLLAVAATSGNRRLVDAHPALFARFERRWFRTAVPAARGEALLLWAPASSAGREAWLAGRRRIGRPRRGTVRARSA